MAGAAASQVKVAIVWIGAALAMIGPIAASAFSPLLAWRDPIYIAAGFAGVAALSLLLAQPLLIGRMLPGLSEPQARTLHRWGGAGIVVTVAFHVVGLWITSPPDLVDALLFQSPTLFSPFGVVAMWVVFAVAILAGCRRRLRIRPLLWRKSHLVLTSVIVICVIAHALLIEGTMEIMSKVAICVLLSAVTAKVLSDQFVRR